MLQELLRNYRKLIPMALLVTLVVLAGTTTFLFGTGVHEAIRQQFAAFGAAMLPHVIHMLIAGIVLNIAWLLHAPLGKALDKIFETMGATPRARNLSTKIIKAGFWALVIFIVLNFTAAEFLSKLAISFGTIGVALTFVLQGVAQDAVCGLLVQFTRKVNEGDEIELDKVKGKVVSVGYLSTIVSVPEGTDHVPNREIWSKTVRVLKPKKSPIILPSGFERNPKA
ncbi:MAG: mechanosensitive ion channel [Candidatus Obscuribacterales bacterium]|jgi:small conductance mechanosensitive channel|nr:mechanosensitive ion channel [Candidatus Obscuribacterales bacterium]